MGRPTIGVVSHASRIVVSPDARSSRRKLIVSENARADAGTVNPSQPNPQLTPLVSR
jgi:hypothetical protein